jgi:Fe2+ or Zn2+ uptake regulation protein
VDVNAYLDYIRAHGHRLTRQRRLVLEIFEENAGHLEAERVYQLAKARDAKISLATVYRCLALLKEAGIVQEHSLGQDHGHFEAVPVEPHYHFTCLNCERVIEFDAPQILQIAQALERQEGIHISEIHLLFNGYCAACRAALGKSPQKLFPTRDKPT